MRLPIACLLAFAAVGCAKTGAGQVQAPGTAAASEAAPPSKPAPDPHGLDCPDGAVRRGSPPPDGLRAWCELPDGREHGPMKSWYDDDHVKTAGGYFQGRPHGHWQSWDEHGALRSEGDYERGEMVGTWTTFYTDGQKATEIRYDGDKADYASWHSNGKPQREGQFLGGEETGTWTEWDPEGNVVSRTEGEYVVDGQSIGVPECDEYLEAYLECMSTKMPAEIREQVHQAITDSAKSFRRKAKTPDGRKELAELCQVAHATMLRSMESLGCG